jgi:hypothetical protein
MSVREEAPVQDVDSRIDNHISYLSVCSERCRVYSEYCSMLLGRLIVCVLTLQYSIQKVNQVYQTGVMRIRDRFVCFFNCYL